MELGDNSSNALCKYHTPCTYRQNELFTNLMNTCSKSVSQQIVLHSKKFARGGDCEENTCTVVIVTDKLRIIITSITESGAL